MRIRFPRGFIRAADHFRSQLSFVKDRDIKDNLAYAFIQTDVFQWLMNRTDLYGTAKEMTIKSGIALLGAICETMAVIASRGKIGRKHGFCERCTRMVDANFITQGVCDELHWLWKARAAIHIYELEQKEYRCYSIADYNRAVKVTKSLRDELAVYLRRPKGVGA